MDVYNQISSYEGLKSKTSKDLSSYASPSNSRLTTSSNTDCADNPNEKVPTEFTWREGGNTVYVTGTFANWKQWFLMSKSINTDTKSNHSNPQENIFHIILELPRGTYQYKFIVDKDWKCSNDSPQIEDEHGNTNNIINNAEVCLFSRRKKTLKKIRVKSLFISLSAIR